MRLRLNFFSFVYQCAGGGLVFVGFFFCFDSGTREQPP